MTFYTNGKTLGAASFALILAACGGETEVDADQYVADRMAEAAENTPSLEDDGFDFCFKAVQEALGSDANVSKINTNFSAGPEVDSRQVYPRGMMTSCVVEYQDPDNPNKMLSMEYKKDEGAFSDPRELEITVIGGNASEFKVSDYVVPLANVNFAGLGAAMESKKAALSEAYGDYAWTGFDLDAPGMSSPDHRLSMSLTGRLASNDVKENGSASFAVDGTTVVSDRLLPR